MKNSNPSNQALQKTQILKIIETPAERAEEDEGAAVYIFLDGKVRVYGALEQNIGLSNWMDTPQTAMTTRAPAVLTKQFCSF